MTIQKIVKQWDLGEKWKFWFNLKESKKVALLEKKLKSIAFDNNEIENYWEIETFETEGTNL